MTTVQSETAWKLVPVEATEAQWGGLARALVMWWGMGGRPTGNALYAHLRMTGENIPDWLVSEIPEIDHVPPKGTVAACIYRAMLAAAPASPPPTATEVGELVERLREGPVRTGDTENGEYELFDIEDAEQTMYEAATALQSQAAALAEAKRGSDTLVETIEIIQKSYAEREAIWNQMQERFSAILARADSAEAKINVAEEALRRIASSLDIESYPRPCLERTLGDIAREALATVKTHYAV